MCYSFHLFASRLVQTKDIGSGGGGDREERNSGLIMVDELALTTLLESL